MGLRITALVAASAALSSTTLADVYEYSWNESSSIDLFDNAGEFNEINASYDTNTERLTWEISFFDQVTDGFSLSISPYANPESTEGQLAVFYFDATGDDVVVTAYGSRGYDNRRSYSDGSMLSGIQSPDLVLGASTVSGSSAVIQASTEDIRRERVVTLEVDLSGLMGHDALYRTGGAWTAAKFGETLGFKLYTFADLTTEYNEDGSIESWNYERFGWFEREGQVTTHSIPTPGTAGLLGLGGLLGARRRR